MEGFANGLLRVFDTLSGLIFTQSTPTAIKVQRPQIRINTAWEYPTSQAAILLGVSGHTIGAMVRGGRLSQGGRPQTVTGESLSVMLAHFGTLAELNPDSPALATLIASAKAGGSLSISVHEGFTATQTGSLGSRTGYGPTLAGALADLLAEDIRREVTNG